MRPRSLLVLTLVLALAAGCTGAPEVGTTPLDLPPARDLLPDAIPGYALGYTTSTPTDGAGETLTRIFDGQGNGSAGQLNFHVARYDTEDLARDHFAFVASQAASNGTAVPLGDEARLVTQDDGRSQVLVVRKASVFWLAQSSSPPGSDAPPSRPDLAALLSPFVDRVPGALPR